MTAVEPAEGAGTHARLLNPAQPEDQMGVPMKRRVALLKLAFGDKTAQPLREDDRTDKLLVNGCKVTQGLVNMWMSHQWVQMRLRPGGGCELALTPLGLDVIGGGSDE